MIIFFAFFIVNNYSGMPQKNAGLIMFSDQAKIDDIEKRLKEMWRYLWPWKKTDRGWEDTKNDGRSLFLGWFRKGSNYNKN